MNALKKLETIQPNKPYHGFAKIKKGCHIALYFRVVKNKFGKKSDGSNKSILVELEKEVVNNTHNSVGIAMKKAGFQVHRLFQGDLIEDQYNFNPFEEDKRHEILRIFDYDPRSRLYSILVYDRARDRRIGDDEWE